MSDTAGCVTTRSARAAVRGQWLGRCCGGWLAILALVGCVPTTLTDSVLAPHTEGMRSVAKETIGQTFVARHAGLQRVAMYLAAQGASGEGRLTLHVRGSALPGEPDVRTAQVAVRAPMPPRWVDFEFPPIANSHNQSFYFFVEHTLPDGAALKVAQAPGAAYPDGAAYLNHEAQDAQLAFQLSYQVSDIAFDLLGWLANCLGVIWVAFALFILPGFALLAYGLPSTSLSLGERLGLAAGLSIALYPLLLLWTDLAHWHWGPLYAWLPVSLSLAVLLWRYRTWRPWHMNVIQTRQGWLRTESLWINLTLLVVVGLMIFVRVFVIRALDVPLWGDSYQHTMIAQLLVDNGGLFNSWQPYAELQTFTYHFGFHSAVAVWHWLTGMEMPQATLLVGQILNALAVLAIYPLAVRVADNRWAGVGAVLVAGLLSPMPMFYVNWGRYTQLAGQVVLPVAAFVVWSTLESRSRNWRLMGLAWIVMAGLAVTHYRVLIFAMLFVAGLMLLELRRGLRRALVSNAVLLTAGAVILFVPWFIHVFAGKIWLMFVYPLSTPVDAVPLSTQQYNSIGDPFFYLPAWLWALTAVACLWGMWRRSREVLVVALWALLVVLAANPQWLRLPGTGILSNIAIFIAAYIPASILVGYVIGWLVQRLHVGTASEMSVGVFLLMAGIGLWGASQRLGDLAAPQYALVTRPDVQAADWIRHNTPTDARFLVNTFLAYGDALAVGSDGGWWLPLLAHRQTTLPPITYGSEEGPRPDYREWVNALPLEIGNKGIAYPAVLAMLHERGVTHVYIGQQQGQVNYNGPLILKPDQLLADTHYRPIYHQDRVWVFEIRP